MGKQLLVLIFLLLGIVISAYAIDDTAEKRLANLTKEIRCVVCQNQNIADSNAPLAKDLREKVQQMIIDKKSDEEIKEYLVQRYGEFILLRPRFHSTTFLLWTFPFLGMLMGFFFLCRFVKLQAK